MLQLHTRNQNSLTAWQLAPILLMGLKDARRQGQLAKRTTQLSHAETCLQISVGGPRWSSVPKSDSVLRMDRDQHVGVCLQVTHSSKIRNTDLAHIGIPLSATRDHSHRHALAMWLRRPKELAMPHAFADIAFTPSVKAAQQREGSRAGYAHNFEGGTELSNNRLGEPEADFIRAQRSFYMATTSETGWPYLQHRGGPRGFLKVLDDKTLAFADFVGNRQLISLGNLAKNDRVALILVDYAHRLRLKLLGRLIVKDLIPQDALAQTLIDPNYRARPQRAMLISVEGFDWNCPQHIPVRIDAEDVQRALDQRDALIAELEARLAHRGADPPASG